MIEEATTDGQRLKEKWVKQLTREKRAHEKWREHAEKVEKRYYDEKKKTVDGPNEQRINVLFGNVQIQHAALLANTPAPEVRRRHQNAGEAEKDAATMIEEAISYLVDQQPFKGPLDQALEDALTPGMGVVRINYDPTIKRVPQPGPDGMPMMGPDGEPVLVPMIEDQTLSLEFFSCRHFHWQPAKRWEDVDWIAFDFKMSAHEINEQFDVDLYQNETEPTNKKLTVTEIWDKKKRQIIVICEAHEEPLEVRDDALGLKDFYPVPCPLVMHLERAEFVPIPEFTFYQHWADLLNELAARHKALVKACRDRGLADASITAGLRSLSEKDDGQLVPVQDLMAHMQAIGASRLSDAIHHWPIENTVRVLAQIKDEIEFAKAQTYELTGISDIVRGASQASETATAQQIKGQWANVRLVRKQNALNRFVRDIFRIYSEIIAEHFQPEILAGMTSLSPEEVAQALPLIKEDRQRSFVIDVESDSTIAKDELEERQGKLEFLQQVTGYLQNLVPQVQAGQMDAGLVKEILLMVVRSWKHGRQLEEYIQNMEGSQEQLQRLQQTAQQQMQQLQQQMQQIQGQLQQVTQQRDQYAKQLQQFNAQEMQIDGMEAQAEAAKDMADARYKDAQTEQLRTQTAIQQVYP